jgi:hypothetical protein
MKLTVRVAKVILKICWKGGAKEMFKNLYWGWGRCNGN